VGFSRQAGVYRDLLGKSVAWLVTPLFTLGRRGQCAGAAAAFTVRLLAGIGFNGVMPLAQPIRRLPQP
jgi:hypothetical protein